MDEFEGILERHRRELHVHCYRMLGSYDDAEDAVQETFLRAWRGRDGFDGEHARAWLYRIAINCALSWLRDHRREEPAEIADDALTAAPVAPGRLAAGADSARLRAASTHLPPKQKLVLELRVFDDLSFKEVAELADCSENTAKVNFHYAVKKLRDILGGTDESRG